MKNVQILAFLMMVSLACKSQLPDECAVKSGASLVPNAEKMVKIGEIFPTIEVKTLNDEVMMIPTAIANKVMLIGVGFKDAAQPKLDSWSKALGAKYIDGKVVDYFETVLIAGKNKLFSGPIRKGMKKGVPKPMHTKVGVYFGDLKDYYDRFGVSDKDDAYIFLIDKTGKVLFESSGNADEKKLTVLYTTIETIMNANTPATVASTTIPPTTPMKDTILYVMDPICPWCFAFATTIEKINRQQGGTCFIKVLPGGLAIGKMVASVKVMKSKLTEGINYIQKQTGAIFGEGYRKNIVGNDNYMLNSEKPCIAINVMQKLSPTNALPFTIAIEKAFYTDGKDLNSDDTYKELIKPFSIDEKTFIQLLQSEEMKTLTYNGFDYASQIGATGFPTTYLYKKAKKFIINEGYLSEKETMKKLETILK
jgi:putative protein-disulfide isomerase